MALRTSFLLKFRKYLRVPPHIQTPFELQDTVPKYQKFKKARVIKRDHDRMPIVDFLLSNLYKAFLHFHNRNWESAFYVI